MNEQLRNKIEEMVKGHKAFLFMKGNPDRPQCGFSAQVVDALKGVGVGFASFDVLSDPDVRAGVKEFSSWPTLPQLYVNGKFVGGCDIVMQLAAEDKLKAVFEYDSEDSQENLLQRHNGDS